MECPHCRKKIKLLGHLEIAEKLGWDPRMLSTYKKRGKLPKPDFDLACGPVWFENNKELVIFIDKHMKSKLE